MSSTDVSIGVAPDAPAEPATYDWTALVAGLSQYLRIKATPVGMKLFESVADMEAVDRIRRPDRKHALDQIVAQARWLNRTVGITMDDLMGPQCGAPVGLAPQEPEWRKSTNMSGVWFATDADAIAHQQAMDCLPYGRYAALAVSPLATGRLNPPDIAPHLRDPGADDHPDQRPPVQRLQEAGILLRGRVGLRGLLGQGAAHGRAQRVDPLFRGATASAASRTMSCSWPSHRAICPR